MTLSRAENLDGVGRPFYLDERLMPSSTMSVSKHHWRNQPYKVWFHTSRFTAELADSSATKPSVPSALVPVHCLLSHLFICNRLGLMNSIDVGRNSQHQSRFWLTASLSKTEKLPAYYWMSEAGWQRSPQPGDLLFATASKTVCMVTRTDTMPFWSLENPHIHYLK